MYSVMFCVEGHFCIVLNAFFQKRFNKEKAFHQFFADNVFFNDFFCIFGSDLNVEHVIRHDLNDRTLCAETEAAGLNNFNIVFQTVFSDIFCEIAHQFCSVGSMATGTTAAKDFFFHRFDVMLCCFTQVELTFASIVKIHQCCLRCNFIHGINL